MADRTIASHRATTSSRTPGKVNQGVVYTVPIERRVCEDCGAVTTEAVMPERHGAHLALVAGRLVTVNCAGKLIL